MKMIKTSLAMVTVFAMGLSTSALATGDAAKGQEIAAGVCAGCHGVDGNSIIPSFPSLAGQHSEYLLKQLMELFISRLILLQFTMFIQAHHTVVKDFIKAFFNT